MVPPAFAARIKRLNRISAICSLGYALTGNPGAFTTGSLFILLPLRAQLTQWIGGVDFDLLSCCFTLPAALCKEKQPTCLRAAILDWIYRIIPEEEPLSRFDPARLIEDDRRIARDKPVEGGLQFGT